jgi:hypothetical protein
MAVDEDNEPQYYRIIRKRRYSNPFNSGWRGLIIEKIYLSPKLNDCCTRPATDSEATIDIRNKMNTKENIPLLIHEHAFRKRLVKFQDDRMIIITLKRSLILY